MHSIEFQNNSEREMVTQTHVECHPQDACGEPETAICVHSYRQAFFEGPVAEEGTTNAVCELYNSPCSLIQGYAT